jgi:rhodanese-related sulfurtransferase
LALAVVPACKGNTETSTKNADKAAAEANAGDAKASEALPDRDPALAHRLVEQEDGVLLDVRTPIEYADGHIDGATNISHDELGSRLDEIDKLTGGDKNRPIVVYCRSGARAGQAKKVLTEAGYKRVTNLGGLSDW